MQSTRIDLPARRLPEIFHLGTLKAADKGAFSWEGHGLSVCYEHDLDRWAEIARIGGDRWALSCADGAFCDFHALNKRTRERICAWGVEHGYAQRKTVWEVSYYDDELADTMSFWSDTKTAALDEAELMDEFELHRRTVTAPSEKLAERLGMDGPQDALDFLVICYIEDHCPELDGVWWEDRYGPLSAPRGVILPERLARWQRRALDD